MRSVLALTGALVFGAVAPMNIPSAAATDGDPRVLHADPAGQGGACAAVDPCDLATAQGQARERIAQGKEAEIELHGGTYALSQPLVLDQQDSGTPGRETVLRAAPGERPVLSAGTELTGWVRDATTNRWYVDAPGLLTRQVYVEGRRAVRARDTELAAAWTATPTGYQATDERIAGWPDRDQVEVVVNTWWKTFRCGVQAAEGATVTMDDLCWRRASCGDQRFNITGVAPDWIENALALLDEPGEWFHDRTTGRLWYMPRPGEDMATVHVVAGGGQTVVEGVAGLHDLRLEGLTFSHSGWLEADSEEGFVEAQAGFHLAGDPALVCDAPWAAIPAAVAFASARQVKLVGNMFEHLGGAGLRLGSGSQDNKITGNVFRDIAASGITLGGIDEEDHHPIDPARVVRGNRIADNVVTRTGREYFGTVGIWVGYAQDTVIAHNELTDLPYTAVSVGWGWGSVDVGGHPLGGPGYPTPSTLRDNRIEHNRIRDILQVNFDGGGIYTLSAQPGTVIRKNVITGIRGGASNHGIYLDDGSRHITVERNVVVDNDHTLMFKGGSHVFRGNYWANRFVGDLWDYCDSYDGAWAQLHWRDFYGATRMIGNHAITSLDEAPDSILDQAGPLRR